jgi:hypothetical protein
MREEYDIRGGVRGKYYERYQQGTNIVLLEPDVAAAFPSSERVNRALRVLMELVRGQIGSSEPGERPSPPRQQDAMDQLLGELAAGEFGRQHQR